MNNMELSSGCHSYNFDVSMLGTPGNQLNPEAPQKYFVYFEWCWLWLCLASSPGKGSVELGTQNAMTSYDIWVNHKRQNELVKIIWDTHSIHLPNN